MARCAICESLQTPGTPYIIIMNYLLIICYYSPMAGCAICEPLQTSGTPYIISINSNYCLLCINGSPRHAWALRYIGSPIYYINYLLIGLY
jgi:hypothetical protein